MRAVPSASLCSRVAERLLDWLVPAAARVVAALPARWVPRLARGLASLALLVDARGLRIGRQNLAVAFGGALSPSALRTLLSASVARSLEAVLVLAHAWPPVSRRIAPWLTAPPEVARRLHALGQGARGAVVVTAHLGAWTLLPVLRGLLPDLPPLAFLPGGSRHPVVERLLARPGAAGVVRLLDAQRLGGAPAGALALCLADDAVRLPAGGVWAPFLGLEAPTTALPGRLAGDPPAPVVLLLNRPGRGRYVLDLVEGLEGEVQGEDAAQRALTLARAVNRALERAVREDPEAFAWTRPRFGGRPTRDLGAYPPYSRWDPSAG